MTMKFLLLFLFVAVALTAEDSETSEERLARHLARLYEIDPMDSMECVRKTEVTMEDMRYMQNVIDLPDDAEVTDMKSLRRANCAVVCCLQKLGVMRGGEVLVEEMVKIYKNSTMPEDNKIAMQNASYSCKEQVTDTSDECVAGYKFMKCVYNKMESLVQQK